MIQACGFFNFKYDCISIYIYVYMNECNGEYAEHALGTKQRNIDNEQLKIAEAFSPLWAICVL